MTKSQRKARTLSCQLTPLVVEPDRLACVVGGGESASTSTSGTPRAGDDTIGDRGFELPDVLVTSWS